jgi:peptidoglycan/LPS O-acetylase OafA/YrhL
LSAVVTSLLPALREGVLALVRPPSTNVAALDVLRSAAILLVFTGHYVEAFQVNPAMQDFAIFRWGWTGVDLFFVLSGFLIGSQLCKELDRTGRIRIGRFLLRRGLRIWPLYYAFVALAALGYLFGRNVTAVWSDFFFLSNSYHHLVEGGWSLSTEEQFYTITPIVLALVTMKLSPRRIWIVPLLGVVMLVSARAWVIAHSGIPEAALPQKLYRPIYTHADGLAVGVFLAWLSAFHHDRLRSKAFSIAAVASMLACGLVLYKLSHLLLNFTALGLIYGSFELYAISPLPLPRVVDWGGFYLLSRLSFGLYLNHMGMLAMLHAKLSNLSKNSQLAYWSIYLLCLLACLLVATATFLLIEWPFLRIRARWVSHSRPAVLPEGT